MSSIDFSSFLNGAGVQLEHAAYSTFGAAVDQFTQQSARAINRYITGEQDPPRALGPYGQFNNVWRPTNYASDLIRYQPKHRFMFRVLFELDPNFAGPGGLLSTDKREFQYVIRHIDRPKVAFEYEDVNMYNFRTKILKTIKHDPLTITMIDDVQDSFHDFFRRLMKAYSPASRSWAETQSVAQLESSGFNFTEEGAGTLEVDSAVRGVLRNGSISPFKSIRLIQYFGHAGQENTFGFVNPRIVDISYDEANHEGGDPGNYVTVRFDYDILYIQEPVKVVGRSPYATSGSDMYSPDISYHTNPGGNDYQKMMGSVGMATRQPGGFGNNYQGFSPIDNIVAGTASSIIGNAINAVSSKALSSISNPFLQNAAKNAVYPAINGAKRVITNNVFNVQKVVSSSVSSFVSTLPNPFVEED